jgi:hypothetical protein
MNSKFYIEVSCEQRFQDGERICGDVFLSKRIKEENRIIVVLSDGMGHGVKANVLATLTSTMAINFTEEHKDVQRIADIIMNTLPVCSERKISYSTFTTVDIDTEGDTRILNYDNPQCVILRGNKIIEPEWNCILLNSDKNAGKELFTCVYRPQKEDRIVICSDGVTQSGLGTEKYPFGWGRENLSEYLVELVSQNKYISASKLATKVITKAHVNDNFVSHDDTSCTVLYFRDPRKLIICTGPPFDEANDKVYAEKVIEYEGKKIACGATTADILAREMGKQIEDSFEFDDPDLPPVSYMEGLDLITEGILTLSKVAEMLRTYSSNTRLGKGPADQIVKLLLESDEIHMLIGTKINIAHQDPTLPVELEIRRTVIKRIARVLEEKFLKEVSIEFL